MKPGRRPPEKIRYLAVKSAPADAIIALYKDAGWWKESRRARKIIPAMIRNSFRFLIARTASDEIIGMGRVISDGVSDAYIQDVVVKRGFRGQGIGREIISRLARICEKRRLEWVGLVAAPGTSVFYRGLGFRELRRYVAMRRM